jgi:hypothetical protein
LCTASAKLGQIEKYNNCGEVITSFKFKFRMPVGANSKEYEFFDEKGRS